jgi:HlyD family secretion protein
MDSTLWGKFSQERPLSAASAENSGKPKRARRLFRILLFTLAIGIAVVPLLLQRPSAQPPPPIESRSAGVAGSALGHIEPEDGVIHVSAPSVGAVVPLVDELRVREGERVNAGQVLAVLQTRKQLEAGLRQCEARIEVARSRLEAVTAGPKSADLEAQRSEIARLNSKLRAAETELRRYETLFHSHDVAASDVDEKRTAVQTTEIAIQFATARLNGLSEIRHSDVRVAQSELQSAEADAGRVRVDLDATLVRAPVGGLVLRIHSHKGEQIGSHGLLDLARTDRMTVIAEVYETDIARIHVGQRATINSELFPETLNGSVELIGSNVMMSEVLPNDPTSFSDSRVIRVKIQVPDGRKLAGLINGKVRVVFQP